MEQSLSFRLFKAMMKEEWRLHQSLVGPLGSGLFPLMIFMFTAFLAVVTPSLLPQMPTATILLMLHAASVTYGLFVGNFGSIGEHVMTRRLGQVSMIMQMPQTYPVSFKQMMAVFYAKDAVFYLLYSYIPLTLGIGVAAPMAGVSLTDVVMLGITTFLTFMVGMGISFTLSAVSVRAKLAGLTLYVLLVGLIAMIYPLNIIGPECLMPSFSYWLSRKLHGLVVAAVVSLLFASLGVVFMKEYFEVKHSRYRDDLIETINLLKFMGELSPLIAKEWIEVKRSGALGPVVFSFSGHLLAIYLMSWVFEKGVGMNLGFNVVFYSGFVGFMGVMTYSFITNLEHNEYLNVQPVSVDQVIKGKLAIYFTLTAGVTTLYVIGLGVIKHQMWLVPIGLLLAAATSVYVVGVTSYLTGLWTNTMFFDAKIILRFSAAVVPPLIVAEIAALLMPVMVSATYVVIAVSMLLLLISLPVLRALSSKWMDTPFSYVNTGQ